jgi:transcriptional regulator with XRE-family HTH domain
VGSHAMIGDLLRTRRQELVRAEAGLRPIGRKVAGLRREEVAYLAGVSVTWYTWLEQGRAVSPSRQVLTALAQTLRLSDAERAYLFSLAGYSAPEEPAADPVSREISTHVQRFLDSLLDFPAYVLTSNWDFLAWNAAYVGFYPGISRVPKSDLNLLWLLFTDPYLREHLSDWGPTARAHVAAFRARAGPWLADARYATLVNRLLRVSETFRAAWESHTIEQLSSRERVFRHPVVGELHLEQHCMTPPDAPGLHVVIFTPTPDTDAHTRLRRLRQDGQPNRAGPDDCNELMRVPAARPGLLGTEVDHAQLSASRRRQAELP